MSNDSPDDHDHGDESAGHNHDDILSRLLGPKAELIFAGLAGLFLVIGWLGPKLDFLPGAFGLIAGILS